MERARILQRAFVNEHHIRGERVQPQRIGGSQSLGEASARPWLIAYKDAGLKAPAMHSNLSADFEPGFRRRIFGLGGSGGLR